MQVCQEAKMTYFQTKVADSREKQKQLFMITKNIMHKLFESQLPSHTNALEFKKSFANFLTDKIQKIRESFSKHIAQNHLAITSAPAQLCNFQPVSQETVKETILETNNKCCHHHQIPTNLLKGWKDC